MLLYLFALRVTFSVFISLFATFGIMAPIGHFEMHYRRCAGDVFINFPSETLINSAILIRIFALDQSRSWDLPKMTALIIGVFVLNIFHCLSSVTLIFRFIILIYKVVQI